MHLLNTFTYFTTIVEQTFLDERKKGDALW
jgi:hypothetical protein